MTSSGESPSFTMPPPRRLVEPILAWARAVLTWEVAVALLAFLIPILMIEFLQCWEFGCGLFLGWDSSSYAWWATQVEVNGAATMVLTWSYPHLYVLMVGGFGTLIGSIDTAERVMPIVVSLPLGVAYYSLSARITTSRRLGVVAAFLGGISISTIAMVADYQRNLFAFGIALLAGAAVERSLFHEHRPGENLWLKAVVLWVPAIFAVLASQLETYVAIALALFLAAAFSRSLLKFVQGFAVVIAPLAFALPLILGYLVVYSSDTALLLPTTPLDFLEAVWAYLGGPGIVLFVVGAVLVVRKSREGDSTARFLVAWLGSLVLLFPIAIAVGVPAARLVPLVPLPIFVVVSFPELERWVCTLWGRILAVRKRARASGGPPPNLTPPRSAAPTTTERSIAFAAVLLLSVAPLATMTAIGKDSLLNPYVKEADVHQLWEVAALVHQMGYSDAILVLYGPNSAYYSPIYRAYFGLRIPNNLAYYGKLQFLFSLPDPSAVYVWKFSPPSEASYAASYRREINRTVGIGKIGTMPIVIASTATYGRAASELFLNRFQVSPGVYIIPPGALSEKEMDTWRLFASEDCVTCGPGIATSSNWSEAPTVLESMNLTAAANFSASYVLSLRRSWSSADLSIRFWDYPATLKGAGGFQFAVAPLDVFLDGQLVAEHAYRGKGVSNLTVGLSSIAAGVHHVTITSGLSGEGVALSLDDLLFLPIS